MMTIINLKDTNTGWTDEFEYATTQNIPGFLRGFNIEYERPDGDLDYGSCIWTYNDPDENNFEFRCQIETVAMFGNGRPTGRVVFRGYATEYYDYDEHETFVEHVTPEKITRVIQEGR